MAGERVCQEQEFWKSIFALSGDYGTELHVPGLITIKHLIAYGEKKILTISCLMVGCSSVSLPEAGSLWTISTRISFLAETTPFRSGQRARRRRG